MTTPAHTSRNIQTICSEERGVAMIIALASIVVLSLLAGIILVVATSEKRSTFNEYTHSTSFYSADAGGEAAVNWLRIQNAPPGLLDTQKRVFVPTGFTNLTAKEKYKYNVTYVRKRVRAGWSKNYKDFEYVIGADGSGIQDSESQVEVNALRLFKEGYGR